MVQIYYYYLEYQKKNNNFFPGIYCNSKLVMKIQLREDQIKSLISGYKTLNEQEGGSQERSWEVNFSALWEPGKWKLTQSHLQSMKPELEKIVLYLRKHPNTKLSIQIVASESRVPNYDREQSGNVKVDEGYLSQKRGEELSQKLDTFFKQIKLQNSVEIPKPQTRIGGPSWTPQDKATDKKFTDHQYVKLIIKGTYSIACLIGMSIKIHTLGSKDSHSCDEAIFDLKVNGVSLGVVNLNNGPIDVGSVVKTDRESDYLRKHIGKTNRLTIVRNYSIPLAQEITREWKNASRSGGSSFLNGHVWNKKPLGEWALELFNREGARVSTTETLRSLLTNYWLKYKPTEIEGLVDLDNGDSVIPKSLSGNERIAPYIGKTVREVLDQPKEMAEKVSKISGRETDGVTGGTRSQTFILDTAKAQEIVSQSKTKDKLILSIKPLVSRTGPYRMFYNNGSHSEVPRVKIMGKDGDVRYDNMPNASLDRGSLEETPILTTDLCGKPITS